MEYINVVNGSKIDVMREMIVCTNSGKIVDDSLNFLLNHKELLGPNEFIQIEKKLPHIPPGQFMNLISMESKYHINVKKSIIVLVMFLLDASLTKGAASVVAGMLGITSETVHKLDEQERCLIMDILIGNKHAFSDFLYNNLECVQNDIKCSYRESYICKRDIHEIESRINRLMEIDVIYIKDGTYKLAF